LVTVPIEVILVRVAETREWRGFQRMSIVADGVGKKFREKVTAWLARLGMVCYNY